MKICKFKYYDNNNDEYPCVHPTYRYSDYCIFHNKNVNEKRRRFYKELEKFLDVCEKDDSIDTLDLKGFIFPKFDFKRRAFKHSVDFRKAHFTSTVNFEGCEFKHDALFHSSQFDHKAIFQGTNFWGKANFINVKFKNKALFVGGMFYNRVVFHGCKFNENAVFKERDFKRPCVFQFCTFQKDADFRNCEFYDTVDLSKTFFKQRLNYKDAKFYNEIKAENTNISNLKSLNLPGVNFDGAVLESANFYEMNELIDFSFKNSFLISCNFSGKKLINCNFTGAVLNAIHTKDWFLDENTIKNTKYIFSNYKTKTIVQDGEELKSFLPDEQSRVPAEGFFGDNKNKDFNLISYFKEPYKWDYLLDFPPEVRTGLMNYLNFFKDYLKATENIDVDIATQPEGNKLRVVFIVDEGNEKPDIQKILSKYIINIFKPFDRLQVEFRNQRISEFQKARMLINYENELQTTQTRLRYGLQNIEERQKTLESLMQFMGQQLNIGKDQLFKLLSDTVSGLIDTSKTLAHKQPLAEVRATSETKTTIHIELENRTEINLTLAKLLDELNQAQTSDDSITNQIESLKAELIELQKEVRTGQDKKSFNTRFNSIFKAIKDLTNYGIQNIDKIITLCDYVSKMAQ